MLILHLRWGGWLSNRVWLIGGTIVVAVRWLAGCRRYCNGGRRDCSWRMLGIVEDDVARECHSLLACSGMRWLRGLVASLCS